MSCRDNCGTVLHMDEDRGLRERKKHRTESALADAALDLFEQRGYSNTTIADIAAAVDVSPRTFFRYFATKEDVAFPGSQKRVELLRSELEARGSEPPFARACNAISVASNSLSGDRDVFLRRHELILSVPALYERGLALRSQWEDIVADNLILAGVEELRSWLIASATVAAAASALRVWVTSTDDQSLQDVERRAFSIIAEGLAQDLNTQADAGQVAPSLRTRE